MKAFCLFLLSVGLLVVGGCAATGESYVREGFDFSNIDKVAIVEVSGAVYGEPAKNQISDFFAMELLKKGYVPVERAQVQALLKEQKFQASDITSPKGIAKAGRILNVSTVMLVNIPTYSEQMNMTAKMLDVEDASALWIGSGSGRTGKTLATIFGAAGGAAAGAEIAGDDSSSKTVGAIAGGVLGGVAGNALSPQQSEQVQKIIKKMCRNLPSRTAAD